MSSKPPSSSSLELTTERPSNWDGSSTNVPPEASSVSHAGLSLDPTLPSCAPDGAATPAADGPEVDTKLPRVFGDYELLQEVARGGMGVVYRARQQSLNRIVALKMILEGQLASEKAVLRFHQEARAAAGLDHPNIVPIYEIGQLDNKHYFSMAFVEGCSLKSLVKEGSRPHVAETVKLMVAVAEAVDFAHRQGIVHRDLKPDNVLIDREGRPRVADFGLAKQIEGNAGLTATGVIMGTPTYMAPEQALGGNRTIGPQADIYALGSILYFLLAGRPPFQSDSITEILFQVVKDPAPPPRQFNNAVPHDLEAVCLKCLEKDPAQRYKSAAELAQALRACLPTLPEVDVPPLRLVADRATMNIPGLPTDLRGAIPSRVIAPTHIPSLASVPSLPTDSLPAAVLAVPAVPAVAAAPPRRGKRPLVVAALFCILGGLAFGTWLALGHQGGDGQRALDKSGPGGAVNAAALQKAALQGPLHVDFGLKVEVVGAQPGLDGVWRVMDGKEVKYRIQVDRDAYVGVWDFQADGNVVQLFPNKFDQDHLIKKGEPRVVPGEKAEIVARYSKGQPEHLRVVASTTQWDPLEGEDDGTFFVFRTEQQKDRVQRMLSQTRGFIVRPAAGAKKEALSEAVLQYQIVQPK